MLHEPDNPCVEGQAITNFCGLKSHEITVFLLHSLPSGFPRTLPPIIKKKIVFDLEHHIDVDFTEFSMTHKNRKCMFLLIV